MVTALQRLPKRSKSVSEPHLSLIDRPRLPEGRFQNCLQLQLLVDFGRASFSKVQPIAKYVPNSWDGLGTNGLRHPSLSGSLLLAH